MKQETVDHIAIKDRAIKMEKIDMFDIAPLYMEKRPRVSLKKASQKKESPGNSHAIRRHMLLQNRKIDSLKELLKSRLPVDNESIHINTVKQFDAFSFVLLILQYEIIIELWAAAYRIGQKTSKALIQLMKAGQIGSINLVLNDGFKAFAPNVDRLLVMNQDRINIIRCNNHAKVTLIKTASGKNYVIEGSGNWSINARIEQYVFLQSAEIFDFHKQWMASYGESL